MIACTLNSAFTRCEDFFIELKIGRVIDGVRNVGIDVD